MPKIEIKKKYKKPIHTKISFLLGIVAITVLTYLGISHMNELFGLIAFVEAGLCSVGLIATLYIRGNKPFEFRDFNINSIIYGFIIFFIIAVIQVIFQLVPLTARTVELALAIVFASISEEIFFRAFLLEMNYKIIDSMKIKSDFYKYNIIALGMILSSLVFMSIHINYYDDLSLMLTVFIGGMVLAIAYTFSDDLLAVILGHFTLNLIVAFQLFTAINL